MFACELLSMWLPVITLISGFFRDQPVCNAECHGSGFPAESRIPHQCWLNLSRSGKSAGYDPGTAYSGQWLRLFEEGYKCVAISR